MEKKEPVWLTAEELSTKYYALFAEEGFNKSFIGMLYDSQLLWGYYCKTKRKVFILESTFLDLITHIRYNYYIHLRNFDSDQTFSIPSYCTRPESVRIEDNEDKWVTPTNLLNSYPRLKEGKFFNESFIGQLVGKHVLRGKYDYTAGGTYVFKPSFDELMRYRNFIIDNNIRFEPDDE